MDDEILYQIIEHLNDDDSVCEALLLEHMTLLAEYEADNSSCQVGGSAPGRCPNVERNFQDGHISLMMDYFWPNGKVRMDGSMKMGPVYSKEQFRRRFSISRALFDRVFTKVVVNEHYFQKGLRPNCVGKLGLTPLQKVAAAIRQLSYGTSADASDEYIRIGESTALESLKMFCRSVNNAFGDRYLRLPNAEDLKRIENQFSAIGFPGCIGCIDCSGWQWQNCPRALQGVMCGKEKKPYIKMEVICDLDMYIWHFYFGLPGMLNDIDIMWLSPLMNAIKVGMFPPQDVEYVIGEEKFNWYYFLADGIYPQNFKIFIQSLPNSTEKKRKKFSKVQEGARKCVERVFAVLFKRFGILNVPGRLWCDKEIGSIAKACVILHNMCTEERREAFIGDGIGGMREERVSREVSGSFTTLDSTERINCAASCRPSEVYDDIDEKERLTNALIDHINELL